MLLARCIARAPKKSLRRFLNGFTGEVSGSLKQNGPVIGSYAECEHVFAQEDVNEFSKICGDNNPLHINVEIAKESMFGGTIVHGILVSSLFSTLFGRSLHGAVYVNQTLSFRRPVHVGAKIKATMKILQKGHVRSGHLLTCSTVVELLESGKVAVEGEAQCLLPYTEYPK